MRRSKFQTLKKVILVCLVNLLVIVIGLLSETIGTDLRIWLDKNQINAPATYILILVFVILNLIVLTWDILSEQGEDQHTKLITADIEPDVKRLYDSLKQRYDKRYRGKLDERFMITLEVREDWNSDKPKTYKFGAQAKISIAIDAIRKAYDERGRLLIVGSPGSGKTVLLLKLALELLGNEYRVEQKLPVIFNLAAWSEKYSKFEDWLIDVLYSGYGLSRDLALTLLKENRIYFLLDGLDELARNKDAEIARINRTKCLDSIYSYAEVRHKLVICCRREEFVQIQKAANQDDFLPAKVEVLDLSKLDIEVALAETQKKGEESRAAAGHLERMIEKNEAILDVLSTPFYFTIALEIVSKLPINQKEFPKSSEAIKQYLHSRFIESKIKPLRKSGRVEVEKELIKIKRRLKWLAQFMEEKRLVTFELAYLQPWDLVRQRVYKVLLFLLTLFCHAIIMTLVFEFFPFYRNRLPENIVASIVISIMLALLITEISFIGFVELDVIRTKELVRWNLNKSNIVKAILSFIFWSIAYLAIGLIHGSLEELLSDLTPNLYISFCFGLFMSVRVLRETKRFSYLSSAYQRLKINMSISSPLVIAYITILPALFIVSFFPQWPATRLLMELLVPISLSLPVISSISFCNSPFFKHCVLRICLCLEEGIPLRYVRFLDYLVSLRILEKDGGQWRFPHLKLQEYFATLDD